MKYYLAPACALVLLLTFGGLAVLARPEGAGAPALSGQAVATPAIADAATVQVESDQQDTAALDAQASVATGPDTSYNVIPVPLPSVSQFPSSQFNAEGLASIVGPGVHQVLEWNPSTGSYLSYIPGIGGDEIPLRVGGVYWLALDSSANPTVSFMGDVPAKGSVKFIFTRPSFGPCIYNDLSIPLDFLLDHPTVNTAEKLAQDIEQVDHVLQWDSAAQIWRKYTPGSSADNFTIKIGYPYHVCLKSGGKTTWPSPPSP
ncbi:MAG: hypothetical protein MUC51_08825 [Anaerolineae bacterium]|jgi:hypothetical protein|nr:hypothetical protein [Anaerolineae bacterium]